MIDVNELRRGNLVAVDGRPFMVIGVGAYSVYLQGPTPPEKIDPIPITPEWLERFGINKSQVWFTENLRLKINHYDECDVCIEQYHEGAQRLKNIAHIHQLQNLYFTLTGEELTIKSE